MTPALAKTGPGGERLATLESPHCVTLDIAPDAPVHALAGWVAVVAGSLDRDHCTAVIGTYHPVVPGSGQVAAQACVTRRSDLDPAHFSDYWLRTHARIAGRVAGSCGYEQLHVDREASARLSARLSFPPPAFDGMARLYFRDLDALRSTRATPLVRTEATADEMTFLDHSRSVFAAVRHEPVTAL